MKSQQISLAVEKLAAVALVGILTACEFEQSIDPLILPTAPERPFGGFSSEPDDLGEFSDTYVNRLINELFDAYNLPGDQIYRGSVYERIDRIMAGAYAYYGYDLAELAKDRQDNPLTEQMILDYLVAEELTVVEDSYTGMEIDVFREVQTLTISAGEGTHPLVIERIEGLDPSHRWNYERNYLSALYAQYPESELNARRQFRADLRTYYGEDSAAMFEYIMSLDQFDVE